MGIKGVIKVATAATIGFLGGYVLNMKYEKIIKEKAKTELDKLNISDGYRNILITDGPDEGRGDINLLNECISLVYLSADENELNTNIRVLRELLETLEEDAEASVKEVNETNPSDETLPQEEKENNKEEENETPTEELTADANKKEETSTSDEVKKNLKTDDEQAEFSELLADYTAKFKERIGNGPEMKDKFVKTLSIAVSLDSVSKDEAISKIDKILAEENPKIAHRKMNEFMDGFLKSHSENSENPDQQ